MREDWVECTFDDLIENISTSNYKIKQKDYTSNGEIPVVDQGQDLIGGYFDNKENIIPVELPVVVFGDHTKCVKYINFQFVPGADGTKVLKIDNNISTKYIYYLLKVLVYKIEDKGYARHFQYLQKELIPLPPLPEQRAIVKKIEALFSSLDAGIADLKKAQDQLKIYRQAVLKKAFEGVSDFIELGNAGEWKGGGTPSTRVKEYWEEGNILWVSSQDVKSRYITDTERKITEIAIENSSTKWVESGSLLFVVRSGILRRIFPIAIAKTRLCVNQDIQTVNLSSKWNNEFVYWFLEGNEYDIRHTCAKDGTTVESVDVQKLKNYKIPVTSLENQAQIVKEIEARLSVCDAVEQQIKDSLTQAEALRQSILKKAFEGRLLSEVEIQACQQAPDYEPASVLLEKIKAEKEANKPVKKTKKK